MKLLGALFHSSASIATMKFTGGFFSREMTISGQFVRDTWYSADATKHRFL